MKPGNSRHGGIISGLLFAGLTVCFLLFVGGLVVARTVRIHNSEGANGTDTSIQTPVGRLNIRTRDRMNPALTGVPVYPGATRVDGSGGASFEWNSSDGFTNKNLYVIGGEFRTKDSASEVVKYYRTQLPSLMIVTEPGDSTRLEYTKGGIQRIISIHEKHGETRIGIASIAGRASN